MGASLSTPRRTPPLAHRPVTLLWVVLALAGLAYVLVGADHMPWNDPDRLVCPPGMTQTTSEGITSCSR